MKTEDLLKAYFQNPGKFSVLVLGPRGIGKTKTVTEVARTVLRREPVVFNCASIDEDQLAESRLFGYKRGAFTGAIADSDGLFHEAGKKGMLFFDEVHTLSKRMQEKLMTQLNTIPEGVNKGKFRFRRLKGSEDEFVRFQPVFASNKELKVLRKKLLPDFFDRICQLTVRLPSIEEQGTDHYEAFKEVWPKFDFQCEIPETDIFQAWLRKTQLNGNYRDLDAIAILWAQAKSMNLNDDDTFEFVSREFNEFRNCEPVRNGGFTFNFRKDVTFAQLMFEYRSALRKWAVSTSGYGSVKAAQDALDYRRLDQLTKVKEK